jgi:hypothetical protein
MPEELDADERSGTEEILVTRVVEAELESGLESESATETPEEPGVRSGRAGRVVVGFVDAASALASSALESETDTPEEFEDSVSSGRAGRDVTEAADASFPLVRSGWVIEIEICDELTADVRSGTDGREEMGMAELAGATSSDGTDAKCISVALREVRSAFSSTTMRAIACLSAFSTDCRMGLFEEINIDSDSSEPVSGSDCGRCCNEYCVVCTDASEVWGCERESNEEPATEDVLRVGGRCSSSWYPTRCSSPSRSDS